MNPSEFVEKLLSPEAEAFRENFSRDVLKKISILAPTEYSEIAGIFEQEDSDLQKDLKLLQQEVKDPSQIGTYRFRKARGYFGGFNQDLGLGECIGLLRFPNYAH